jgi:hypothetical protein
MREEEKNLFANFAPRPDEHFRIFFFGSVLNLIEGVARTVGAFEKAIEGFPFLVGYNNELAELLSGLSSSDAQDRWLAALEAWERAVTVHLPLRALRLAAGVSHAELMWLLTSGLVEEDARFGGMFEALQGAPSQRRPTLGFLRHCLPPPGEGTNPMKLFSRLTGLGALSLINPEAPRQEWAFRFPNLVWDALRTGEIHSEPDWVCYKPPGAALDPDALVLPPGTRSQVAGIPRLLESGEARTVVVRGPRHNGRHTLLGAVARSLGRGLIEIKKADAAQNSNWNEAGALAVLLDAMPVVELAPGPGEVVPLPALQPASLPLGVVMGVGGGLAGVRADQSVVVQLELPGTAERHELWQRCKLDSTTADQAVISARFRLTSGNIGRAAQFARAKAALAGRARVEPGDVLEATRAIDRQGLDTLARRLSGAGDLARLSASERTLEELEHLARRCRQREVLPGALAQSPGGRLNCGVRALFTGPTGTGKTLAARLLGGTLQKDLYRLDLSYVVNKFIGETEKNLNRLFDSAEELDVILLLDEGDALLTQRTDVHSANDRYANLETNFLLQRMESFQGILIVTTNARNRIDPAFERRMDVVVEFTAPSAEERWKLWQSHLPANCATDEQRLTEIAGECELTGGQIHNAVLHATLLALDNGGIVTSEYIEAAVRREYRKRGGVCPLRH